MTIKTTLRDTLLIWPHRCPNDGVHLNTHLQVLDYPTLPLAALFHTWLCRAKTGPVRDSEVVAPRAPMPEVTQVRGQ